MAPGQVAPQIRVGRVLPGQDSDLQQYLCSRLTTRSGQQAVTMTFDTPAGPLVLKLSRKGMHMWLRGLTMVLRHAQWGLPHTLPSWLIAGLMPPVIRALVQQPLPDNLDPDQDAS